MAGRTAKCKQCGVTLQIPTPDAKPPAAATTAPIEAVSAKAESQLRQRSTAIEAQPLVKAVLAETPDSVARTATDAKVAPTGAPIQAVLATERPTDDASVAAANRSVDSTANISIDQLLGEIQGAIQPVPTTMAYRLTAAVVAFVMVLLPLLYIGLIGLVAYGVYNFAVNGTGIFEQTGGSGRGRMFGILLLYVGPIVVGAVTVVFMIKPLFARPAKRPNQRRIPRETEPRLFQFIDALCDAVHAPKPKRIDIDCEVNASASYGRGMLSVFMSNDLVLTIGLPLVAGLTTRQLAGVLAHEFGHFSQGFGMRLSYLIRSISFWFARVVYERDRWDESLANLSQSLDIRLGIVLYLARLAVWLSRRILWVLMMIGNAVSCSLLRQMEYDADLHEIRFSGSETFESTAAQLRRLGLAMQQSYADQQEFFVKGQLASNMPDLVRINRDAQDSKTVKEVLQSAAHEKTHWLATHPADKDRVAQAREAKEPGIFHLEAPARVLFEHFEKLCEATTRDVFEQVLSEDEYKKARIVPNDDLLAHKQTAQEGRDAMKAIFGEEFNLPRPLAIRFQAIENAAAVARDTNAAMLAQKDDYQARSKQLNEVDSKWIKSGSLAFLLDLGIKLKQKDFEDISVANAAETRREQEECRMQLQGISDSMQGFENQFATRFAAALTLLHQRSQSGDQAAVELLNSAKRLAKAYPAILQVVGDATHLRNEFTQIAFFFAAVDSSGVDEKQLATLNAKGARVYEAAKKIRKQFGSAPYPLQHAEPDMTIARYLVEVLPEQHEDLGEAMNAGQTVLESYTHLYFSVIEELCRIITRSEKQT